MDESQCTTSGSDTVVPSILHFSRFLLGILTQYTTTFKQILKHKQSLSYLSVAMSATHMNPLMLNQICTLGEGFPTYPASVGLFSCVNPLVLNKACSLAEVFVAVTTLIGPLPSVSPSMLIER